MEYPIGLFLGPSGGPSLYNYQVETDGAFTYARRSTYDNSCIFAIILFTSICQIWYNS